MDSCHLFNFLFGTRKATSELRKCFSRDETGGTISEHEQVAGRRLSDKRRPPSAPPSSPLKQIQLKIANLTTGVGGGGAGGGGGASSGASTIPEHKPSIFSTSSHEIVIQEKRTPRASSQRPCPALSESVNGIFEAHLVRLDEDDCDQEESFQVVDENNNAAAAAAAAASWPVPAESRASEPPDKGRGAPDVIKSHGDPPDGRQQVEAETQERSSAGGPSFDKTKLSKSERVRGLVQAFELPVRRDSQQSEEGARTPTGKPHSPVLERTRCLKPPKTPPKTNRAKCLNWQLCLNKPTRVAALFQDERFLTRHFFDKLEPLDRCSAAQVCRAWRNILYSDKRYWRDLVGVIDCTQLRREHLVECILNTVHSAKLRQGHRANGFPAACDVGAHQQQVAGQLAQHPLPGAQEASAPFQNLSQLDQDEIWRIQELCNRFTARGFAGSSGAGSGQPNNPNSAANNRNSAISSSASHEPSETATVATASGPQTTSGIANSKSSSSQISSSTLSSVSISSLLSPLSESSRIDSIREKLYTALDERGFESVCLFGATDEDLEDLARRTRPNGAQAHIRLARLSNCAVSDRGLEVFLATFGQLEELELTGCNELTNTIDLRRLVNLRRLIITDCINIADGFAQRLAQVLGQLEVLVVQAYHLTDAFLEYLALNAEPGQLRRLELPNCKEITNNSALTIAKSFSQLEALSLSGSCKINDDGAEIIAEHMKRLATLDLGWMKMSDFALECLACDMRVLRELTLDRNTQITDIGLGYLATMTHLSLLYVRWCPQLTDNSIRALASMRSLRHLSLAGLHQVTARGLLSLVEAPWLRELELTNCPAVTSDLLAFLAARLPGCNIIY